MEATIYSCPTCKRVFKRKQILDIHVNKKICNDKKFACNICNSRFASMNSVYRHKRDNCKGCQVVINNDDNNIKQSPKEENKEISPKYELSYYDKKNDELSKRK